MWQPGISDGVYPTPGDLVRDLVALQITEIEGLIDEGVRWIQLDSLGRGSGERRGLEFFDDEPAAKCRLPSGFRE